jgi:uncharacterized membrane protein
MWHGLGWLGWAAVAGLSIMCLAVLYWLMTRAPRPGASAIEILNQRYARGEITREEFETMKRALGEPGG